MKRKKKMHRDKRPGKKKREVETIDPMPTDPMALGTEKQAAKHTGLTVRFFQARRAKGDGPAFVKISARCIRYRRCDLDQWIEKRLRVNTIVEGA